MKRDMDLVREILLWATQHDEGSFGANPKIPEYTEDQVAYHVHLMEQAGLVTAADIPDIGGSSPAAILTSVTWIGHDFIDAAKDNTTWNKAKNKVLSSGVSFTFDLLKELLALGARGPLGLP